MAKKQRQPKPFPHPCPECGATAVYAETTSYMTAFKYEGRLHEFEAPNITLNKCRDCGSVILPNTALDQIAEAFRQRANLLTAERIRYELQRLKLSQKEFGALRGGGSSFQVERPTISLYGTRHGCPARQGRWT